MSGTTTRPLDVSWELWTWKEVAQALKVSRSWVYAKAESGELPSVRVSGLLRFEPPAVRQFAVDGTGRGRVFPLRPSSGGRR